MTAERADTVQMQQSVSIGLSNRSECEELEMRVANLDSMARQPQTEVIQDWIKDERKTGRDRRFAIRC